MLLLNQPTPPGASAGGGLFRWLLRLVFIAAGLLFALSLLAAVLLLAAVWALRALWARLTGRPVAPWVMRVDPRAGWQRVYEAGARRAAPSRRAPPADVTDVEVKDVEVTRREP